jgi:hypothetical protein
MRIQLIPQTVLFAARQRLGADDAHDTSKDKILEASTPMEIIGFYSGWMLGDNAWGPAFAQYYIDMVNAEKRDKESDHD